MFLKTINFSNLTDLLTHNVYCYDKYMFIQRELTDKVGPKQLNNIDKLGFITLYDDNYSNNTNNIHRKIEELQYKEQKKLKFQDLSKKKQRMS